MIREMQIPLFDLVMCLSDALDLISLAVVNHHKQVAYIAYMISRELGLPVGEQKKILIASLLHDIGAFSLKERICTLRFEIENPHQHSEIGYALLSRFESLSEAARIIRYHHIYWAEGSSFRFKDGEVPLGSYIVHLADRSGSSHCLSS